MDLPDREVLAHIRQAIRNGDLLAVHPASATSEKPSEVLVLRRLVAQIERQTRGSLSAQGRQYKLVVGDDLVRMAGRDRYEVVPQADARVVLDQIAFDASVPGDLLAKAKQKLSKDWRPPFSGPDGLVLLRRIPIRASVAKDDGPALTPSQLKALLDDRPFAFFARFVDDHGKPVTGLTAGFAHGDDPKDEMAFSGATFVRKGDYREQRQAWLTFSDKANQDLVAALTKRWKEIRGKPDDAWKQKAELLVEVQLQAGKLPELGLAAEKKHTFMLRPPVAMAHMQGMYFDTNKCFLLPSAVPSLKRLVETYAHQPDSEVLIVGHTDTAGSAEYNLELSADRADAMKAFLRDDAGAWLAWYEEGVRESKRWGRHEDLQMIDTLLPVEEFGGKSHVADYQAWHNGDGMDARQVDQPRARPPSWEELKIDGILGPKTRRQLILDYMNLDGTTLADDVRIVTYGCGEYFPLASEEGEIDRDAQDGEDVPFDRRVEVFLFARPFGVLPPVPGVADGESPPHAAKGTKDDELYLEWRRRVARRYAIDTEAEELRLRLCDSELVPYAKRPHAFCLEGYPEVRGETDADGVASMASPPAGAHGYVEVWPDDEFPDASFRWEVQVGSHISQATPLGASIRLANLDYFLGEPTDEMTDELADALACFQADEGLDATGELDEDTCGRLTVLHEWEEGPATKAQQGPATTEGGESTP